MATGESQSSVARFDTAAGDDWVLRVPQPVPSGVGEGGAAGRSAAVAGDGSVWVVFDGILFEGTESARVVDDPARQVLDAYRRQGSSAFTGLRGNYVIVVGDAARGEAFAVRDHLGVVPLFWAQAHDGGLLFSPSVRALVAHPEVGAELHLEAVAEHALLRWLDAEETLYRSVRRVPPACALRVGAGSRSVERYWHPMYPTDPWITEDQLVEFDDIFSRAVERCMAYGNSGIFLSGGIDSVSVAAVAGELARQRGEAAPLALSLSFPHESCNEEDVQRAVAGKLGFDQIMRPLYDAAGGRNLLQHALRLGDTWPHPMTNYWLPAYLTLAQEGAQRGRTAILTGGGGDEWLGVTPYYAADLLRAGDVRGVYRLWRQYLRSTNVPPAAMARNLLWQFGLRDMALGHASRVANAIAPGRIAARRAQIVEGAYPEWAVPDGALRARVSDRILASRRVPATRDLYRRELDESLTHPLVTMEAEDLHEYGRRAGVHICQPFWDPDVVEFLARVPPELLNQGGRTKGLVREMVARRFPGMGFERQRKIVSTPFASVVLLESMVEAWEDLGGLRALSALGIVDGPAVESEVRGVASRGDHRAIHRYWYLLGLEKWVRATVEHGGT